MKRAVRYLSAICFVFLTIHSAAAAMDEPAISEYRDAIVRYSILMNADELTAELEALTVEQWQALYDLTRSKRQLVQTIMQLEVMTREADEPAEIGVEGLPEAIGPGVVVEGEFEPGYPDMNRDSDICISSASECYAFFIFRTTLFNLAFLPDDGEVGLQDDRWEEQQEATMRASHEHYHDLALTAQVLCDAASLGAELALCPAAGVAWKLDQVSVQAIESAEAHTGNIDSAEIEAAYENTRTILDRVNGTSAILGEEMNFTDDDELASHQSAIIDTMTSQHGALNAQLTSIANKLDQQQAQLNEHRVLLEQIVRLLNTPQGRRPSWNN